MNCDCFQIYLNREPAGIRLRCYADGDAPIVNAVLPCWAGAFRAVMRTLAKALLRSGEAL